jgi:hypothetical protein
MTRYRYAEIDALTGIIMAFGHAPFLPSFPADSGRYIVDITYLDPPPNEGDIHDRVANTFAPPPDRPDRPELVITSLEALHVPEGGRVLIKDFADVTIPKGAAVAADVEVRVGGECVPVDLPFCRLPIKAIDGAVTYAIVDIAQGHGHIEWTPESTGCWQIREELVNSHLPPEAHLGFSGVDVFVY